MDDNTLNTTPPSTTSPSTSGTVVCTPKNPQLNTAEGQMAACDGGTIQVTMGMFFDGTGNNKVNTNASKSGRSQNDSAHTSFFNSWSNVARSSEYYIGSLNGVDIPETNTPKDDNIGGRFNIYIEGIGTNNNADDDFIRGLALGIDFVSGIRPRVILGTKKAAQAIMEYEEIKNAINTITKIEVTFDVFGFSRGAAAARHFIDINNETYDSTSSSGLNFGGVFSSRLEFEINELFEEFRKIEVEIHWRFAGLYETVSSHGLLDLLDFDNDVIEIGLNAISNVDSVLQIVAKDEYRRNFSLTNIDSVSNKDVISIPGVHSDIGGGYSDTFYNGTDELNYQLYRVGYSPRLGATISRAAAESIIDTIKNWFIDQGWYTVHGLSTSTTSSGQSGGTISLIGTRGGIKNTYSHIPLHMMTNTAIEKGVNFNPALFSRYPIVDNILNRIYDANSKSVNLGVLTNSELKAFRRNYLHWSSRHNNIESLDPFINIEPNAPRLDPQTNGYPKFKRKTIDG